MGTCTCTLKAPDEPSAVRFCLTTDRYRSRIGGQGERNVHARSAVTALRYVLRHRGVAGGLPSCTQSYRSWASTATAECIVSPLVVGSVPSVRLHEDVL